MLAACGGDPGAADPEPRRVSVLIAHADTTSTQLSLPGAARPCGEGRALLIEAASEQGSGIVVLLRYGDSLVAGSYRVLAPGDTSGAHGAEVAVRYMRRDVAHGFTLDSGAADLTAAGRALTASVHGRGLEGSTRVEFDATLTDVPLSADTVSCRRAE